MGAMESSLFDFSPERFPWQSEQLRTLIHNRRAHLGGYLFIDRLLEIADLDSYSLYPPSSEETFMELVKAINGCHFDRLKKNCLIYYILKFWQDKREEAFAERSMIPAQFAMLSDAYWYLDQGDAETAVHKLCDPRVTPDFVSHILRAIAGAEYPQLASKLVLRFVRMGRPVLVGAEELDIYVDALCGTSMMDAWMYQRTFPEDDKPNSTRSRLLRRILDFCLSPYVRAEPLKALVAFPFTAYEDNQVTAYALKPPQPLNAYSLSILQELITVRLIHQGRYSEAIRLDRQFALDVSGAGRAAGADGANILAKAAESRRQTINELMGILPLVQRKLLEVELDGEGRNNTGPSSAQDMSMSWEQLDKSTSTLNATTNGALGNDNEMSFVTDFSAPGGANGKTSPLRAKNSSTLPISGSPAFRQANPQVAVLQAFAQSSRMEGSPSPAVRMRDFARNSPMVGSPLRSALGTSMPFGTTVGSNPSIAASAALSGRSGNGAASGLAKMMNRPAFNIRPKSGLNTTSTLSPSAPPTSLLASTSILGQPQQSVFAGGATTSQPPFAPTNSSSNPFYRPPEEDEHRSAGPSQLRSKRSFGKVAQALSPPLHDMDMDDHEPDSEDDVVLNQSRINPRSVGSLAALGQSQPQQPPSNGHGRISNAGDMTMSELDVSRDLPLVHESEDVDIPGAFPSPGKLLDEIREEPLARRTRGRSSQPDTAPQPVSHAKRSTRTSTSAINGRTSTTTAPAKKAAGARSTRSGKAKEKEKPAGSEDEGVSPQKPGAARRTTRGTSRLSTASSTGSPERKKQRSVEPELPVANGDVPAPVKKATRASVRKSGGGAAAAASGSGLVNQPSRMVTRRHRTLVEE